MALNVVSSTINDSIAEMNRLLDGSNDILINYDISSMANASKVDEIIASNNWTHDFNDGKGEIEGAYGPWFVSLETGWIGIGIHVSPPGYN